MINLIRFVTSHLLLCLIVLAPFVGLDRWYNWKTDRIAQIQIERIEQTGPLAGKTAREMLSTFNLQHEFYRSPSAFSYGGWRGGPLGEVYIKRIEWISRADTGSDPLVIIHFDVNPCNKTVRMALAHGDGLDTTHSHGFWCEDKKHGELGRWEPLTWEEYEDILIMYHSILAYSPGSSPHPHSKAESLRLGRERFENLCNQAHAVSEKNLCVWCGLPPH